MLIPCKAFAFQGLTLSFEQVVLTVEAAKNENPSAALELLTGYQLDLTQLKIEQRIQYYKLLSEIHAEENLYLKTKIFADKGLALAKDLSSPSIVIAQLLYAKGYALENLGEIAEAESNYENGLELAKSLNQPKYIGEGLINLGAVYYLSERFEASIKVLNEAYTLANQTEDDELKGSVNNELSILYWYLGQRKKSLAYQRQAYQHFLNAGQTFYAFNTLSGIAQNLSQQEEYEEAINLFKEVIDGAKDINSKSLMYSVYSGMSWALLKQKESDPEASYQYILLAGQYIEDTEHHDAMLYYLFNKTEILKELERYDEALDVFFQANELLKHPTLPQYKWFSIYTLILKSEILHALSRHEEAYRLISDVIEKVKVIRREENLLAIDDLRLRYESEQADLLNEILVQEKTLRTLELAEADRAMSEQRGYLLIIALLALILAWVVIKLVYGQEFLLKASRTDSLTGVFNRRHTMQLASQMFKRVKQSNSSMCVFMIDVDHFKVINDKCGHSIGDKVLKEIADQINNSMRTSDIFGRFGGEEFVAFLPKTSLDQGLKIAERLRLFIYQHQWPFEEVDTVSVSIGVSVFDESVPLNKGDSLDGLLRTADVKLYLAKQEGRNKVCS